MEENKIYRRIDTELLNIVEADGTRKLCLFNSQNVPPALMDGVDILPGHRQGTGLAGIMFYNTQGDECGGLAFSSEKKPDGGYRSDLAMSFDQYKNDQLVQMAIMEEDGKREYGFKVYDRPDMHIRDGIALMQKAQETDNEEERKKVLAPLLEHTAVRMHIGKKADGSVGIRINDKAGNERIRLYIDENDQPHFEICNPDGTITDKLIKTE